MTDEKRARELHIAATIRAEEDVSKWAAARKMSDLHEEREIEAMRAKCEEICREIERQWASYNGGLLDEAVSEGARLCADAISKWRKA